MNKEEKKQCFIGSIIIAGFLSIIIGFGILSSYFEAKAYNAATGKKVTTWQAMCLDLKVIDSVEENND